jgi:ArsR family transcriptional regulator
VLSDPYRLQIVQLLRDGEKCVCETVPNVVIMQPVVSRHLKILKDFGIVRDRKERNRRFYSIVDRGIFNVIDAITSELLESLSKRMIKQRIPEEHP